MRKSRSRRTRPRGPSVPSMEVEIHRLAGKLMRQFRKLHPGADQHSFRDEVERVFHKALTRRIRKEPRRTSMVTKAERMWRRQLAERRRGTRARVCWRPIGLACIPGFKSLSESERPRQLRRLRNAVFNRNARARKRARAASRRQMVAHDGPETG